MWEMDYDKAANVWIERDKGIVAMEKDALKERIEKFIQEHNTCALATANADMVRNTPIEYMFFDGAFYLLSEGGLKYKCLKDNKKVGIAIFESFSGFGKLKGLQVEGEAYMIEPFSEEYLKAIEVKKIPVEGMKRLPMPLNLIKVVPKAYDYLESELKNEGFGGRQHLDLQ